MSTLALGPVDAVASADPPGTLSRLVKRLLEAREDKAKRSVLGHLAAMDDARLAGLGFTAEDIQALRAGELRLRR